MSGLSLHLKCTMQVLSLHIKCTTLGLSLHTKRITKLSYAKLKGVVSCFFSCRIMKIPEPGIAQLVLFMIFLQDFVSPKKRIMSEGCWLFTLEMTIQSLGNRVFPQQVISAKHIDWSKAQTANISSWRPKMKKLKVLYFLEL